MSFILDALKKSEVERQRQSLPGLMQTGTARPRQGLPLWAIGLGVLLAVNMCGLIYLWMRSGGAGEPATAVSRIAAHPEHERDAGRGRTAADPKADDAPFSPLDSAPIYAPEISAAADSSGETSSGTQAPSGGAAGIQGSSPANAIAARPVHRRDPVLSEQDFKAEDAEILPTINELNLTGAQALPDLHLDVHVFSTRPADRFVYVNMRKYHEGATLEEGPIVERIRRDGAVLNYQGLRFLLPRQ